MGKKIFDRMTVFTENCTSGKVNLSCELFNFYIFMPLRVELFSLTQVLFCLVGFGGMFGFFCGVFCCFLLGFFKA